MIGNDRNLKVVCLFVGLFVGFAPLKPSARRVNF